MKKILLLLAAVFLGAATLPAQSLLNSLKRQAENAIRSEANKAVNDARRDVRNTVTNSVRGAVNNARNGAYSNNNNTNQQLTEHDHSATWTCPECGHAGNDGNFCGNCGAKKPAVQAGSGDKDVWTCPECGKDDNEGSFCPNCGADRPAGNARPSNQEASAGTADEVAFVPGTRVIFEDTLSGETVNEDPSKWELLAASMYDCYVTRQAGEPAILLSGFHSDMKPRMKKASYLPESFTVEMDIWFNGKVENALKHSLELNFASEDVLEEFSAIFRFCADEEESGSVALRYWKRMVAGENLIEDKDRTRALLKPGAWNHAAVSFDHGTVVLFVNGSSVLKVTEQNQPTYIRVDAIASGEDNFIFRNFRIAAN